jgi:hypothetical protein
MGPEPTVARLEARGSAGFKERFSHDSLEGWSQVSGRAELSQEIRTVVGSWVNSHHYLKEASHVAAIELAGDRCLYKRFCGGAGLGAGADGA